MRLGDLKVQGQRDVSKGAAIVHYADALTLEGGAAHAALVAVHAELAALSKRADLAGDVELAAIDELVQKHPRFAGN